jgi:N-methylhydantoinase A/oxoprolinase/acetone carboxylase beta subunit
VHRIAVDIGGTFTDCVLVDEATGAVTLHKLLTTPDDPSDAVLAGVAALLEAGRVDIADVSTLVHGTTLVTNALIERKGSRTGMLVTAGMRDILDIGRERRYDLFDLRLAYPQPVVPRSLRREIAERIGFDGAVSEVLDADAVIAAARELRDTEKVEAIAICFLNSYANDAHEAEAARLVREAFPDLLVSTSAEVFPYVREYERWTTATMNAYVQPLVDRYISHIDERLAASASRRQVPHHDVERRHGHPGNGAPLPDPPAGIRPGGGRADVGASRQGRRHRQSAVVRHGRHHGKGRAGARRPAAAQVRTGSRARPRVQGRAAACPPRPRSST